MPTYTVTWVCDIEADSPEEACLMAREWLTDPHNTATVFYADRGGKRTVVDTEGGKAEIIRDERKQA